jgi:hypothetical protein
VTGLSVALAYVFDRAHCPSRNAEFSVCDEVERQWG